MKHKKKLPKPRNEFVAGMRFKRSGAHEKTYKATRRAAKVALRDSTPSIMFL